MFRFRSFIVLLLCAAAFFIVAAQGCVALSALYSDDEGPFLAFPLSVSLSCRGNLVAKDDVGTHRKNSSAASAFFTASKGRLANDLALAPVTDP